MRSYGSGCRALAEVEGLLRAVGVGRGRLRVVPCDAAAHGVQRVTATRNVELLGGGGTDMGQGIATACAVEPAPAVVVVLTDGFTPWPDQPPPQARVVVGLLREGGPRPPGWARVVRIDEAA